MVAVNACKFLPNKIEIIFLDNFSIRVDEPKFYKSRKVLLAIGTHTFILKL